MPAGNRPPWPRQGPDFLNEGDLYRGRHIQVMVCCVEQSSGPRLRGDPGGGLQPSPGRMDSEQQHPRRGVGVLRQRGGPTPCPHGFGGQHIHAVFQGQKELCRRDAL